MPERYDFPLQPSLNWQVSEIGTEKTPVIVIDGVLQDPDALVDYAAKEVAFTEVIDERGGYPGVRAPAPLNYVGTFVKAVDSLIRDVYGLSNVALANAECSLSIVTTERSSLQPKQCLPHIDTSYPLQFAILHFLCDKPFGGTAFFRQNATGYERISPDRYETYEASLDISLARTGRMRDYIADDDPDYFKIASFDATFDRTLIYPSCILHSGIITQETIFSKDPRRGRLTSNIFVSYS
jgi:hypothetical protein